MKSSFSFWTISARREISSRLQSSPKRRKEKYLQSSTGLPESAGRWIGPAHLPEPWGAGRRLSRNCRLRQGLPLFGCTACTLQIYRSFSSFLVSDCSFLAAGCSLHTTGLQNVGGGQVIRSKEKPATSNGLLNVRLPPGPVNLQGRKVPLAIEGHGLGAVKNLQVGP